MTQLKFYVTTRTLTPAYELLVPQISFDLLGSVFEILTFIIKNLWVIGATNLYNIFLDRFIPVIQSPIEEYPASSHHFHHVNVHMGNVWNQQIIQGISK